MIEKTNKVIFIAVLTIAKNYLLSLEIQKGQLLDRKSDSTMENI